MTNTIGDIDGLIGLSQAKKYCPICGKPKTPNTKCPKCGYEWHHDGILNFAICPKCRKTFKKAKL